MNISRRNCNLIPRIYAFFWYVIGRHVLSPTPQRVIVGTELSNDVKVKRKQLGNISHHNPGMETQDRKWAHVWSLQSPSSLIISPIIRSQT